MSIYTLKHGVANIKNSAGTRSVELGPGPGNFAINGLEAGNVGALAVYNRGTFLEHVEGPENEITGTITVLHDGALTAAGVAKWFDGILKTGLWASDATKDPGGLVWTVDLELVGTRNAAVETHTLINCRVRISSYSEGEGGNEAVVEYTARGTGSGDAYSFAST